MSNILFPREYIDSVYTLDYEAMYAKGIRGLIFDIDNTIVPDNALADDRVIELFRRLNGMGFTLCILSNNRKRRVEPFAIAVGSVYIFDAAKPSKSGYVRALNLLKMPKEQVAAIGDQIFTDIAGANRAGIYSILTKPLDSDERFHIKLKRIAEKPIIWLFEQKNS